MAPQGPLELRLPAAARVAVLGLNGSGKSALLLTMLGLLPTRRGSVSWEGRPLDARAGAVRRGELGVVPQALPERLGLSLLDYVLLGRAPHCRWPGAPGAADRALAEEALSAFGLAQWACKPLDTLSGGQRRRAQLARVYCQRPALWVLDEPTSALDPAHAEAAMTELGQQVQQGATLIFTTQDPDQALRHADWAVLLFPDRPPCAGRAEAVLSPAQLSEAYGCPVEAVTLNGCRRLLIG